MKITLPVSNTEVEIVCPSYGQVQQIRRNEIEDADAILRDLYGGMDWDALPSRDAILLLRVTLRYALGEPVAAIKNSLAGGEGALTDSETITAPTA